MKILKQDKKEGMMELLPETLDDLWHLSHIVEVGDNVSSKTTRRIQDNTGDKLRSDRGVKKTFFLGIEVESISFHIFTGKLRLTGVITRGPEDLIPLGSHHTLEVKLNTPLIIKKDKWSKYAIKRVNQAIESSKKLSAIIVVLEDDTATLGLIRQFGIEYYGPINGSVSGKRIIDKNRNKNILQFYQKIVDAILKFDDIQNIIVAGPGFVKNDFYDFLKDKYKDLAKKSIVENIGTGGRVGIGEVIKKGTVEKLTVENRVANEIMAVNDLLTNIAKNSSKVVYGLQQTKDAVNMGAVEKLLVLDLEIPKNNLESIMEIVENMSGEVVVISSEHEGGQQLESLGGVAAILRYAIS
ncbi:MAG: mRNA surveillance protein pelota [Methanobrevibacter sp.]|uniref:mRNA surveillance protein pelota n=1 Tax=Methanobrevibacter sp. TaxID=66852 RepID=UPI0026DEB72B|nr:mRNA surveillance protein pelota [Methanobrevibacter sp.]MDO5848461.1 mRNA surveillance protein pelota [Methanobrevibacter sp.]